MRKIALALITVIAFLHFYIAWFEIFSWTSRGPKIFTDFPSELFGQTTQMAANQGIYNAFLAAGLLWSVFIKESKWQANVAICFLLFVAIAGVFGALTVTMKTLIIQTVPAMLALAFVLLSRSSESK